MVYVTNTLYEICYGHRSEYHPRHLFLQKMLSISVSNCFRMESAINALQNEEYVSMALPPTNLLIQTIRINLLVLQSSTAIDFIDDLPRNIVSICTLPLIVGYIRNEGICLPAIPDVITQLIAFFFLMYV